MAKATASIGIIELDDADFIEFNHYDLEKFCDIGAMTISFACSYLGDHYEVCGDFICGNDDTVTVAVTSVSKLSVDEDGDLEKSDYMPVEGLCLDLPYRCVLTVYTTCFDIIEHEQDMIAIESAIAL